MKVDEVIKPVAPINGTHAETEALKRQTDELRKRKQALKVSKARERLAQAQQAQTALLNKGA